MGWLKRNIENKKYFMVLQGFGYTDAYSEEMINKMGGKELYELIPPPNLSETKEMADLAIKSGASTIIWWGPSLLENQNNKPWQYLLKTAKDSRPSKALISQQRPLPRE